jgi:hypothetical protein
MFVKKKRFIKRAFDVKIESGGLIKFAEKRRDGEELTKKCFLN